MCLGFDAETSNLKHPYTLNFVDRCFGYRLNYLGNFGVVPFSWHPVRRLAENSVPLGVLLLFFIKGNVRRNCANTVLRHIISLPQTELIVVYTERFRVWMIREWFQNYLQCLTRIISGAFHVTARADITNQAEYVSNVCSLTTDLWRKSLVKLHVLWSIPFLDDISKLRRPWIHFR